jgi:outer membrane protein
MEKMKKRCIPVLLLLACAPFAGKAQTPAPGVVTVTFNAAVLQTAEAQQQLAALQTKYAPRQAKLQTLNDQVTSLQKQLDAAGANLSDAERASREQTLATRQKELQRDAEDFKSDSQSDSQEVFQGVARKMYIFLQKYAQQHNYPMVVERGSDAQPVVWYAANNLDITADLIKAYDAQSGVSAPAAKPSVPSAPKPQTAAPKPQ